MVEIDTGRRLAISSGKEVRLSPKEYTLLLTLARADGKVLSREQLIAAVWGKGYRPGDVRTVDAIVARVRRALGKDCVCVVSVTGFGYRAVNLSEMAKGEPITVTVGRVVSFERTKGRRTRAVVAFDKLVSLSKGAEVTLNV